MKEYFIFIHIKENTSPSKSYNVWKRETVIIKKSEIAIVHYCTRFAFVSFL